jgi:uroporphyrinogen-III synthase
MNYKLQGGCQVPVAGYAEIVKGKIRMRGMVGKVDGSTILFSNKTSQSLSEASARQMGEQVAQDLLDQGADKILQQVREQESGMQNNTKPVVVLTRQARFLGNMATILETLDYQPVAIETLSVQPLLDDAVTGLFKNLSRFTDILFVSRNAVEFGMDIIQRQHATIPESTQVLAVGAETAKQLYKYGVDAFFPDHGSGADALLGVAQLANLQDRKILVVRGTHGLVWPAEEMRKRGATVEHANVYAQNMPENGADSFKSLLENHKHIEGVFLHSAQSATNFMQLVRKDIAHFADTILVVGSERISEVVKALGWRSEIRVAQSPSNKHMMICFSGNHSTKL